MYFWQRYDISNVAFLRVSRRGHIMLICPTMGHVDPLVKLVTASLLPCEVAFFHFILLNILWRELFKNI